MPVGIDPRSLAFAWPLALWLLLLLPLLAVAYTLLRRRRARAAGGQYAGLQLAGAAGAGSRRAAWLPGLLWLLALALFTVALARPQLTVSLPKRVETVVLAIDMSGSMRATDLKPDRMTAARAAARTFVEAQPSQVRIAVVGVAAAAALVQSPTTDRQKVIAALDRLEPQRGTALGSGLIIALDTALPAAGIDVEGFINPRNARTPARERDRDGAAAPRDPAKGPPEAVAPGSNTQAAIVLLSDGQNNVGPEPGKAAEVAARYGVRIYTVGVGTRDGAIVTADGMNQRTRLDDEVLKKVATTTLAEYFRAEDAEELKRVYRTLGTRITLDRGRPTEVTALAVALALLAALAAAALSLWRHDRLL